MAKKRERTRRSRSKERQIPFVKAAAIGEQAEAASPDTLAQDTATVVAVGASAGGLDAFSQILEKLAPSPDVAFIFVQHLSPQHESAVPSLLAAHTTLPVVHVTDGMPIESDHVYVMPPNTQLEVVDGRFSVLPRPHDRSQFTPIDFFFESIARWAQERVIGVILSGTASDGAIGIREMKAFGGITIAQKPETAKYDGMPRAAIATGMIDLILTPKEIAEHIGHVRLHPYVATQPRETADETFATDAQFQDLFGLLRRSSGIDFRMYKTPTIRRRVLRRMALQRVSDMAGYLRYVREHPKELTALCRDLLIHVTRFFRDPDSFKVLEAHVLHEIARERDTDSIRIWVPGCATGEEAYSVAIVLQELLGDRAADRRVQIFATDVSETAIEQARVGIYPASIAADITPERLSRFFTKSDGSYRVSKTVRDLCIFARHDLARDPPFSRLELIVCRNVLIYLDPGLQKRVISVFHYALRSGGFLMLGSAETTGPQAPFTLVDKKWRLYRKASLETGAARVLAHDRMPETRPPEMIPDRPEPRHEARPVQDDVDRLVLDKYAPPGVVVDTNFDVVHFRGRTGSYLEAPTGEPSLNVLKMAAGGLLYPLRSALNLAKRKRRPSRKENVLIQKNGAWTAINLQVVPLITARGEYYLVLFEAPAPSTRKARKLVAGGGKERSGPGHSRRVNDLRQELAASREYLQSIIQELEAANEQLQSANEEILSSNEELQSTNEELDTAKEELQSTNEELNTVNEELHSRNEELARVNSDLVNLLGSVDLPIVIVGDEMVIRRFTPSAEKLFNLIASDIGRPIGQINPNIVCDNLEGLIRTTIERVNPQELDVRDRNGRWYSLRIRPYKSIDNRLDGAVLAAIDVDAARQYQGQLEKSRDYFTRIVEMVDQPVLVLDGQLRVRSANKAFCQRFKTTREKIEGTLFYELPHGQWNVPELRDTLAAASADEAPHHVTINNGPGPIGLKLRSFRLDDASHWILMALEMSDA